MVPKNDDTTVPHANPVNPKFIEINMTAKVNGIVIDVIFKNTPGNPLAINNRPFIELTCPIKRATHNICKSGTQGSHFSDIIFNINGYANPIRNKLPVKITADVIVNALA